MCKSLNAAVNKCINCCFVHLYLLFYFFINKHFAAYELNAAYFTITFIRGLSSHPVGGVLPPETNVPSPCGRTINSPLRGGVPVL